MRAEHGFVELRAHDSVAVLSGVGALVLAHHLEGLLGDCAHLARALGLLEIDDRANVQGAHRGVCVPGSAGPVPGEDLVEPLRVLRKIVE
jgi:hypothetical protein